VLGEPSAEGSIKTAHDLIAAMLVHRHWDRPNVDAVPA